MIVHIHLYPANDIGYSLFLDTSKIVDKEILKILASGEDKIDGDWGDYFHEWINEGLNADIDLPCFIERSIYVFQEQIQ